METCTRKLDTLSSRRLRAIVEIVEGELKVYPIANSDEEAKEILNSLHLLRGDDNV